MRTERKGRKSGVFLNIIIVVLAVIFAVSLGNAIREVHEAKTGYLDKEEFLMMDLRDGDYVELARRWHDNGAGVNVSDGVAEYYAVGRYFEQEFLYRAFENAGLGEKARRAAAARDALIPLMGEFAGEAGRIRESLP